MKKFWNLMLAALVIFGAVACTENQEENIPEAKKEPVLSFVANIANDETRTHMEKDGDVWKTEWDGDETLYINGYEFTNSLDETSVFNCYTEGVEELLGADVYISNGDYFDSKAGMKGAFLWGHVEVFDPATTISLEVQTSFFHFTSQHDVTLTASENIFEYENGSHNTVTISASEDEKWVAFIPHDNITLSYSIGGVKCKEIKKNFANNKIYNLGFLGAPSDWEISDGTRFYTTETADLFVAKNVKLAENKFCLHKVGDTAWGAGAKYGLATAGAKSENTAIGLFTANWAGDITISNAATTAHDFYFDRANSRLYVMTVGKHPSTVAKPTNSNSYNIAGSMNNWGSNINDYKFTYSGDNVWHIVVEFKANDQFKVQLNNGWGTSYGYDNIHGDVGKGLFSGTSDGNAKAKNNGTYDIWLVGTHNPPLYIIKR